MHDPDLLLASFGPFTLWHHDPCRGPGGDDSCGFFMRSYHGDKKVLDAITRDFEYDWDRVYMPDEREHDPDDGVFKRKIYHRGFFKPDGDPVLSVHGVVLNLFFIAALKVFRTRRKAVAYLNANLFEILFFAENPIDSMRDGIVRTFAKGCDEPYTPARRKERIESMASCIYGYILRDTRPWWKHPRWHVHHWRISCRWIAQWRNRKSAAHRTATEDAP